MIRNFERSLSLVLKHEGGFVDHPKDPGGATNKGVTIGTYRRYVKKNGTVADLKALTTAQAGIVYRKQYWDAVKGDELPDGVDYAVFDFAVNSGPSRAAKYLQTVVGAAPAAEGQPPRRRLQAKPHCGNQRRRIMAWRLARSLETLRAQINALSPNRSKISDGTIGDAAHSSRASDHNPDSGRVVRALDVTHDPAHGIGGRALANALVASRDARIKYIISDGQIVSGPAGPKPWVWRKYTGSNKHTMHVHISVVAGKAGDDGRDWTFDLAVKADDAGKPVARPRNPVLSEGARGPDVERLQLLLNAAGAKLNPDSDFGPKTKAAVIAFQRKAKLAPDGIVGPYTWEALGVA